MKFFWMLLIFHAAKASKESNKSVSIKKFLDPSNADDNVVIWKNLFVKLNTIVSETEKLNLGLAQANERLENLNKKQDEQAETLSWLKDEVEVFRYEVNMGSDLVKLHENLSKTRQDVFNLSTKVRDGNDDTKRYLQEIRQKINLQHSETMKSLQEVRIDWADRNFEGPLASILSQAVPVDKDEDSELPDHIEMKNIKHKLKVLWDLSMPVNGTERLEKTKKIEDLKWMTEMTVEKRQKEIKKKLDILWESEMRANDKLRSQERNLELEKFWKIPEINGSNSHPWTPILRRQDGSVNFYRNWTDYKNGFGDVKGEFFIGLEKLHNITANGPPQELLLILQDFALDTYYAKYDNFQIASESEKYAITKLGNYTGNAGDNLGVHKGSKFSTADNDNSGYDINCAYVFDGAWWFLSTYCYSSHLNGPYGTESTVRGIIWTNLGHENSLSYAELLIRPKL